MPIVVQKFGGTSVANLDRIRNVARRVIQTYDQGNDVVVILSAMSGVTDSLIELAHKAAPDPDKRELDVLLATGEQTTAALLAMVLKSQGYAAQSLLGHQADVVTDCTYGNARILEIGTGRLDQLLKKRTIVVVAGFQGYDIKGNITTLGRVGSAAVGWLLMQCSRWAMVLHGVLLLAALAWAWQIAKGSLGLAVVQAAPVWIAALWLAVRAVREPLE